MDNHPLAGFTWEVEDTLQPTFVVFKDNSFYEPAEWYWDFGDGESSMEINPKYTFPAFDTFTVCLTVSNQYGSDTFCRLIDLDTTLTTMDVTLTVNRADVRVYPNPAKEVLHISYPHNQPGEWVLYDQLGRTVRREVLPPGQQEREVSLAGIVPGLYFWRVSTEGRPSGAGKLIISKN